MTKSQSSFQTYPEAFLANDYEAPERDNKVRLDGSNRRPEELSTSTGNSETVEGQAQLTRHVFVQILAGK